MKKGLVQLYTGENKGKTTAAIGLIVRAVGRGLSVKLFQFMKSERSGEIDPLEKLGVTTQLCNSQNKASWLLKGEEIQTLHEDTIKYWNVFQNELQEKKYDIFILDEFTYAISMGIIALEDVITVLQNKPIEVEIVLTGRNAPEALYDHIDLITEMKKIKHPFDIGVASRIGIEK